jgi:hypothetical protein
MERKWDEREHITVGTAKRAMPPQTKRRRGMFKTYQEALAEAKQGKIGLELLQRSTLRNQKRQDEENSETLRRTDAK